MVDETGQPYAYTGDDPVNAVDPLGLMVDEGPGGLIAGNSGACAVEADKTDFNDWAIGSSNNGAAYTRRADNGPISPWIAYPALGVGLFLPGLDDGPDEAGIAAENEAAEAEKAGSGVPESSGVPKPSPNFVEPTNPPQYPPSDLPPGYSVRVMPPTEQYPDGYWREFNESGQPVDPSTGNPPSNVSRAVARAMTHVPFPANG